MPISINQSLRLKGNNFIEAGFGTMLLNDGTYIESGNFEDRYQLDQLIFRLGYKRYFGKERWLFKISYTPILMDLYDFPEYIHWGGLSLGYRF